ncbi:MAG: mercuric reductase [Planctomycetia bacterium]|nr:mercuric reductase [Planctomycetia bacterium]
MQLEPADRHNQELVEHAHPAGWKNPVPAGRYNLVAIGGGTAGIIAALGAAGLGGRAALVERHLLGGDCLNYGCVPSKALIRASRAAHQARIAGEFGVRTGAVEVDFAAVMERMRRLRARISHHDSAQRFSGLGVDVFLGDAKFTGPDSLEVNGRTLKFARAVIATGGRAAVPDLPGLAEAGYLTNETVFSLTELPRRLVVLGAGPIGCELAQCFRRLGSDVVLVNRSERFLPKEDPEASRVVREQFVREGIEFLLGWGLVRCERQGDAKRLVISRADERKSLEFDAILVAVGRTPNVEGLGLDAAGVQFTQSGVTVNGFLQTTNKRIYAAGDVAGRYQFTHAADAMARLCVQNALFFGRKRLSRLVVPRCTFTDPELAHVGLTPAEAAERGIALDTFRVDLKEVDRAILDGEEEGFAAIHVRKGTGRVVGATIVAASAGDMIGELSLLLTYNRKLSLGQLASVIHAYPTQVEVLKRAADAYSRTRLTPNVAWAFKKLLQWRRS